MKRISTASVDLMSVFKRNKKGMCRILMIYDLITTILLIAMLCVLIIQTKTKNFAKYRWLEMTIAILLLVVLIIRVLS